MNEVRPRAAAAECAAVWARTVPAQFHPVMPERLPPGLSQRRSKYLFFGPDIFFREGWWGFHSAWGDRAADLLQGLTFVLVKPDGIVARAVEPCLAALADEGFVTVYDAEHTFERYSIRELWRYELNLATPDRMDAIDLLLPATPSRMIILHDIIGGPDSASARLTGLKGTSRPTVGHPRQPEHLRARIGAGYGLLNFIHTPDETADFVREVGVLLTRSQRAELIRAVEREARPRLEDVARRAYAGCVRHDLDIAAVVGRLDASCRTRSVPLAEIVLEDGGTPLDEVRRGSAKCRWQRVLAALARSGIEPPLWDKIVFAAANTETDMHGIEPLLRYADGICAEGASRR